MFLSLLTLLSGSMIEYFSESSHYGEVETAGMKSALSFRFFGTSTKIRLFGYDTGIVTNSLYQAR